MPITAAQIDAWMGREAQQLDLASLEGGSRLRARFVAFLALGHPELLQAYLRTTPAGPYEAELLMLDALTQLTKTFLHGCLSREQMLELLSEWSRLDEDAYELLTTLRRMRQ